MRIGFSLPFGGALATVENIATIAARAELLDYHTLYTGDRLLYAALRPFTAAAEVTLKSPADDVGRVAGYQALGDASHQPADNRHGFDEATRVFRGLGSDPDGGRSLGDFDGGGAQCARRRRDGVGASDIVYHFAVNGNVDK